MDMLVRLLESLSPAATMGQRASFLAFMAGPCKNAAGAGLGAGCHRVHVVLHQHSHGAGSSMEVTKSRSMWAML
jgi:hypothetical protein